MILYYVPGACSLAPHIVAREAGIELRLIQVDMATRRTVDGRDFRAVTAKGMVPALQVEDGQVLTETAAILQYLGDIGGLSPKHGSFARYRLHEWLNWISSEVHKSFGPLWLAGTVPDTRAAVKAALCAKFDFLDASLGERDYLLNDFTAADAYALVVLSWARFLGIDLSRCRRLVAYTARITSRPAVRAALAAEGLVNHGGGSTTEEGTTLAGGT